MMTCDDAELLLHALIDGELDAGHARAVEAHAASCSRCAAQWRGLRDLRARLAVAAHLRSLQAGHLTDVASSDQHTVKPWFNGRVDIAPPVVDLAAQGFPLIGGRLDYIAGRTVAALVYRRRKHVINLFVGESLGSAPRAPQAETAHGFNIRRWSEEGLTLLAVSDISGEELQEFADRFRAAAVAGGG